MALGERIRQCRVDAHLSQEKVAELVGVSRQAVTKWEMNQSAPSTENLFRLAEILGTSVDFLAAPGPAEELSLAEQVYQLYKAEEEKKRQHRKRTFKQNLLTCLGVLGGYLSVFLAGRIIGSDFENISFISWLFYASPRRTTYLFGWLLSSNMFLYASMISALPALFGKRWYSLISMLGFMVALPLGEFCGRNPYWASQHWGWAIWLMIFLDFSILGGLLQHLWKEKPNFRLKAFWLFTAAALIGVVVIILCFRLSMGPAPYA